MIETEVRIPSVTLLEKWLNGQNPAKVLVMWFESFFLHNIYDKL
nr:MAG TPA: hypothetical protein [Caudoviricetes sp.]